MDLKTLVERQHSEAASPSLQPAERPPSTYRSPLQPTTPSHEQPTPFICPKTTALMIPCEFDSKTGSSKEAIKRRANNAASKRSRVAKKKLETTLTEKDHEIQRISELRDHFRSERDFYRDELHRYVSQDRLPPRPSTPHQNTYS